MLAEGRSARQGAAGGGIRVFMKETEAAHVAASDEDVATIADLLQGLFPLARSISGPAVRATYDRLRQIASFDIIEVPTGTVCFDWTVPEEWSVSGAWIRDSGGKTIVDYQNSNLHVVGYSVPVVGTYSFEELRPHLFSIPECPDAIPYRTSYYARSWGFCLSHRQLESMDPNSSYMVCIESTFRPGAVVLGERVLGGQSSREILITTYGCHPSLANDNLSGVIVWAMLLKELSQRSRLRNTYRFAIFPETIGALAYIARRRVALQGILGGFVLSTVGGPGKFGYKQSFDPYSAIDSAAVRALTERGSDFTLYPFDVNGSDERQFSTPGIRLPTGTITKDKYYEYPFYHTSLDDLSFVKPEYIAQSLALYRSAINKLEGEVWYRSKNSCGEPMLRKRGLHHNLGGSLHAVGGESSRMSKLSCLNWLMFYGDGKHTVEEVSTRIGINLEEVLGIFEELERHDLVEKVL